MKQYHHRKFHASETPIKEGDYVLVRQSKQNKLTSPYDPRPYKVITRKGTMITAERPDHSITRNIQHFKFYSKKVPSNLYGKGESDQLEEDIKTNTRSKMTLTS